MKYSKLKTTLAAIAIFILLIGVAVGEDSVHSVADFNKTINALVPMLAGLGKFLGFGMLILSIGGIAFHGDMRRAVVGAAVGIFVIVAPSVIVAMLPQKDSEGWTPAADDTSMMMWGSVLVLIVVGTLVLMMFKLRSPDELDFEDTTRNIAELEREIDAVISDHQLRESSTSIALSHQEISERDTADSDRSTELVAPSEGGQPTLRKHRKIAI